MCCSTGFGRVLVKWKSPWVLLLGKVNSRREKKRGGGVQIKGKWEFLSEGKIKNLCFRI